jgi:ferric-dicitrate binding protein FerR (iron transport regulator)
MQEIPNDTSHDLLVKYLLGETTPAEAISVEQWLKESHENRHYFDQLKNIWDESKQLAPSRVMDEEEAWQRFRNKQQGRAQQAPVVSVTRHSTAWLKIAAVFILIAGAAYLSYFMGWFSGTRQLLAGDQVATYTLPDGSLVTLNKYASISYPHNFKGNTRTVQLTGEAFFDVTADPAKPFIINVDDVQVKVVGTSFNVKNTSLQTEVVVESGVVDVSKHKNAVQVKQHEKVIVPRNSDAPEKTASTSRLYNYYRTNQFVCVETPLPELVAIINEAYQSNVSIGSSSAASARLTATFQHKSLDQILTIISETLNLTIERTNDKIILK